MNQNQSVSNSAREEENLLKRRHFQKDKGSFLLDSSTVRKLIAKHVPVVKVTEENQNSTLKMLCSKQTARGVVNDNSYYGALMKSDNYTAPIALVVPDGKLHVEAEHGE